MNEIRNSFLSGFSIVPIIFILPQIKNAPFLFLQSFIKKSNKKTFLSFIVILFFVQSTFKSNLRVILETMTAESEKFYLKKMLSSVVIENSFIKDINFLF